MGRERPELRMPRAVEQPIVPMFVKVMAGIALTIIVLFFAWAVLFSYGWGTA